MKRADKVVRAFESETRENRVELVYLGNALYNIKEYIRGRLITTLHSKTREQAALDLDYILAASSAFDGISFREVL